MRKGITLSLALLTLALAVPAGAQQVAPQALEVTASNVTAREAGRENPDSRALPGDQLEYRLVFTNVGEGPAVDVVFNNPIAEGLVIVLGTATADRDGVVVDYSIDSGESWSASPTIEIEQAGQVITRPAPASAYTHVRWSVTSPVAPGAQVTASFRAQVPGQAPGGAR